ncbi:CPBP family intramembrane metalloprotease [Fructobacillus sp. M2-14]|uniref:CPBP family intramembrane metalloprotease n=1 Tax=Fructobacillus broussonetiae TaxID=2713173 RepID=A0ABS5R2Y4_9LACO|nr:CPBP family intramembrane glutamic endopeptidase [Fructobacillus broussonetiae]MBS9339031.1 CPBP family intramembrane metalloprotease [Fructobacillus broussonetiae]
MASAAFELVKQHGPLAIIPINAPAVFMEEFFMASLTIALFHFFPNPKAEMGVLYFTSALFALTHGPVVGWMPINFLYLFILRMFINWAWRISKTLWGAVLFHFVWNSLLFLLAYYQIRI